MLQFPGLRTHDNYGSSMEHYVRPYQYAKSRVLLWTDKTMGLRA